MAGLGDQHRHLAADPVELGLVRPVGVAQALGPAWGTLYGLEAQAGQALEDARYGRAHPVEELQASCITGIAVVFEMSSGPLTTSKRGAPAKTSRKWAR